MATNSIGPSDLELFVGGKQLEIAHVKANFGEISHICADVNRRPRQKHCREGMATRHSLRPYTVYSVCLELFSPSSPHGSKQTTQAAHLQQRDTYGTHLLHALLGYI